MEHSNYKGNGLRMRFVERDFLRNKIKRESTYITDAEIDSILDEHDNLQDVTVIFYPHKSGFATAIFDNNSDTRITLDDLSIPAFNFYIEQA